VPKSQPVWLNDAELLTNTTAVGDCQTQSGQISGK